MILSDIDIKEAIKEGKIIIEPFPEETQYQTTALDLRINGEFKEYNPDLFKEDIEVTLNFLKLKFIKLKSYLRDLKPESDGSFIIKSKRFILAQTYEKISLPPESQLAARIEGRSSTARLGLAVHLSAPTIHTGFKGKITLELINNGPFSIRLYPQKDIICQLIFEQVVSKPERDIQSQFQGQTSVIGNPPN
jgi:dCTP deaminase